MLLAPFLEGLAYKSQIELPPKMHKHIFSIGLFTVLAFGACLSSDNSIVLTADEASAWSAAFEDPAAHAMDIRMYQQGKHVGDAAIQFDALHAMLAREPKNIAVKDSLAVLYFQSRMYGPSMVLTNDLIEEEPESARFLEMRAVSQNSLGLLDDALVSYEKLLSVDPNPYYAYQIATLQYGLNKYDLAEASVDNMLAADLGSQQVNINTANGRAQTVPMKAALLNIKGVLRKDVHQDLAEAKQYFQLAMAEAPEFKLAANNLRLIEDGKVN